ncbi:hypothetical protein [Alteribacillus sp. HJP-4]|uniref:hypothetical protein n=1 Tax=Alteribacillus sp. HJP-4 TaxID=2775394 RepID=UPI0035CD2360
MESRETRNGQGETCSARREISYVTGESCPQRWKSNSGGGNQASTVEMRIRGVKGEATT